MNAINLRNAAVRIPELFEYTPIARMNGHVFTLVKAADRTLDFHTHADSDEVFFVVEGEMVLEFRDRRVPLAAGEMCVVPKGVEHRPVCTDKVTVLLVEYEGTLTPENTGGAYRRQDL